MGFLLSEKTYFQIPYLCRTVQTVSGFSGRPDRSTGSEVGRPDQSTDVHRRARLGALEDGRPGRSTASESFALWKYRPTGPVDRQRDYSLLQWVGRPSRSTGGSKRSDFWPLAVDRAGRPVALTEPQRLYFLTAYKRGSCQLFLGEDFGDLWASFSNWFQKFSPHNWVQILPILKGVFIKRVF